MHYITLLLLLCSMDVAVGVIRLHILITAALLYAEQLAHVVLGPVHFQTVTGSIHTPLLP